MPEEFGNAVTFDRYVTQVNDHVKFLQDKGLPLDLPVIVYDDRTDESREVEGIEFNDDDGVPVLMVILREDDEEGE